MSTTLEQLEFQHARMPAASSRASALRSRARALAAQLGCSEIPSWAAPRAALRSGATAAAPNPNPSPDSVALYSPEIDAIRAWRASAPSRAFHVRADRVTLIDYSEGERRVSLSPAEALAAIQRGVIPWRVAERAVAQPQRAL